MTESTVEQTHALLLHVGDFLRKLPADQIGELLAGDVRLALVPKGARVTTGSAGGTQRRSASTLDTGQVAADLSRIDDRAAATQYLNDLRLTVAQLKQLCKDLDIPVGTKARKDDYVSTIVGLLVGRRRDHEALYRNASAR